MKKGTKIFLIILIPLIIIVGSFGGYLLWNGLQNNNGGNGNNNEPPVLLFPIEDTSVLEMLGGYGYVPWGGFHNGIDFIINESVNVIASCNMTVNDKSLFYNELGDHWQAGVSFTINDDYELFYAFESFAENETYGNYQYDAILVEIGQEVTAGQLLGQLLYHRPSAHIHYMLHYNGEAVCPYSFFDSASKATFDALWEDIGFGGIPCNETTTTTTST